MCHHGQHRNQLHEIGSKVTKRALLTGVLYDLGHGFVLFGVVALQILDLLVGGNEVDLVLLTNNFASEFGLVVLLTDIAAFVVEQAVRVTQPGY